MFRFQTREASRFNQRRRYPGFPVSLERRKLRRVMDTSLGDIDDRRRDHFRQGVVAILDAERIPVWSDQVP